MTPHTLYYGVGKNRMRPIFTGTLKQCQNRQRGRESATGGYHKRHKGFHEIRKDKPE